MIHCHMVRIRAVLATVLSDETTAYQVLLEGHRAYPDDEHIYEDMLKAKVALTVAWLNHLHAKNDE
jgi:hypothetical protein